ncbi:hypothetical protein [Zymobacter sp. IVIA_12111.31 C1]|uniref:hypothetical protein n=1 Tax=Zymobacter sp. IVIA_12111.31 C1 TaxID=3394854 RepID=UPI0039C1B9DE
MPTLSSNLKLEYLLLIDMSNDFCCNIKSLINFINSHEEISLQDNTIRYKKTKYKIHIDTSKTYNDNIVCHHITVKFQEKDIDNIPSLQRNLSKVLHTIPSAKLQLVWDDISLFYSQKSYPYIYTIENLMRKLITKFMIVNVGHDWHSTTLPEEMKESSKNKDSNFLYNVDFIQLSIFLFTEWSNVDSTDFFKKLLNHPEEKISVSEIKKFAPKSNWDRYFKGQISQDGSYIKAKWSKLYSLRCNIAHNNKFSKKDFEELTSIYNSLESIIQTAIKNLEKMEITEDERNKITKEDANNQQSSANQFTKPFSSSRSPIDQALALQSKASNLDEAMALRNQMPDWFHEAMAFRNQMPDRFHEAMAFRNQMPDWFHEAMAFRNQMPDWFHEAMAFRNQIPAGTNEVIDLSKKVYTKNNSIPNILYNDNIENNDDS